MLHSCLLDSLPCFSGRGKHVSRRNSMAGKSSASAKADYGGSEGNSRERKSSRSGSDSGES
jgi:hypothetical protein